jgi:hypothetical protein
VYETLSYSRPVEDPSDWGGIEEADGCPYYGLSLPEKECARPPQAPGRHYQRPRQHHQRSAWAEARVVSMRVSAYVSIRQHASALAPSAQRLGRGAHSQHT